MPLRAEFLGRIDPILAASLSEEITDEVANGMDYNLSQVTFCKNFSDMANAALRSKYPLLGARVTSP